MKNLHKDLLMYLFTFTILLIIGIITYNQDVFISGLMTGASLLAFVGFTFTAIQIEKQR
jgi:hypothetical protein